MSFLSSDCLKIRLTISLVTVATLHLVAFAVSLPETKTLYEDVAVGVVLVPWQQDDVAVDGHSVVEVAAAQEPAVAQIPTPIKESVTDKIKEPSVQEPVLAEQMVVEEEVSEMLAVDVSPVLLHEPFAVSENSEPTQQAVVAPQIDANTTDMAVAESVTQTSRETLTGTIKEPATSRSDQQARPRYGHHPPPSYPRIARQRGWQGVVEYEVRVLPTGKVADLVLKSSSGYRILDEVARKAIVQWRFNPATRSGAPIESWVVVPVEFVLDTH